MPYEVLEKQIKALPRKYYDSLVDYVDYLTEKARSSDDTAEREEAALQKMREASLKTVWEQLKDDAW